jgi:hypothetical protein
MKGRPLVPDTKPRPVFTDCFYYVCVWGQTAARRALRDGRKRSGLIPFGTTHKPFSRNHGRWVAGRSAAEQGYDYGAIYVRDKMSRRIVRVRGTVENLVRGEW